MNGPLIEEVLKASKPNTHVFVWILVALVVLLVANMVAYKMVRTRLDKADQESRNKYKVPTSPEEAQLERWGPPRRAPRHEGMRVWGTAIVLLAVFCAVVTVAGAAYFAFGTNQSAVRSNVSEAFGVTLLSSDSDWLIPTSPAETSQETPTLVDGSLKSCLVLTDETQYLVSCDGVFLEMVHP